MPPSSQDTEEQPLTAESSILLRLALAAAGAAFLVSGIGPALSQVDNPNNPILKNFGPRVNKPPQPPQQVKPELVATFGNWRVECQTTEPAAGQTTPQKTCGMKSSVEDQAHKAIGLTVWLRKTKKQGNTTVSTIQVITPIGVYLPLGIAVEIDGNAAGRLPYFRCAPRFCLAFSEIVPTTLDKFRKGSSANFILYEAPGVSVPLAVSLKGFTAAYDSLDKYD